MNNRPVPTQILLITGDAGESYECLYARHRLLEAGLPTDAAGTRILFPPDVVERAIASAPPKANGPSSMPNTRGWRMHKR